MISVEGRTERQNSRDLLLKNPSWVDFLYKVLSPVRKHMQDRYHVTG